MRLLQICCIPVSGYVTTPETYPSTCELMSSPRKRIRLGDVMKCYCLESPLDKRLSKVVTYNLVLWPTVLFVVGFVALFLFCVRLCREKEFRRSAKSHSNSKRKAASFRESAGQFSAGSIRLPKNHITNDVSIEETSL